MKFPPEMLKKLEQAIKPLDTQQRREQYRKGNFPGAEKVKDLNKRYRWDLLWASKFNLSDFYKIGDDANVDTALRKIVPDILVNQKFSMKPIFDADLNAVYAGLPPDNKIVRTTIKKDRDTGEWIVKGWNAAGKHVEDADYFTNDKADAEATAKAMVQDSR